MSNAPISDTFAQQLQQMRAELIAQIRAQRGGKVGRAEAALDPHEVQSGDWAQVDGERDLAQALDERETAALRAIDDALQRIADGRYGLCVDCGVEIPTARLHASPTTLRCIDCQTRYERAHPTATPSL
ncbi:TraR/DksA family transcriptional regulator [Tepidimonas taiwanensis]|uniref:RNA polymerase-binding transcription factor DksA n=1 Tax=Tepidimonas taiwanensis TaxID=307486 RepID=A0A554X7B4_9BURK|nr:TraR/DksA family transcriptional regulator [Tepidimonas taiwanensis]MCX7691886.1 TraR/DksA family transcriptional regulator [Tepidimonas taiwanensis]MDM7462374.1 TraR/DksA family transcriptional regulator [Tepidimonas taiwanensis]TSE31707.1 RNA polymerase-binding transcription factor DksA [Tepidimonas taiwanensis]UBQ05354.1 TraR/DksA family transcriptional regulator [Tepidimonas taiwanensis]